MDKIDMQHLIGSIRGARKNMSWEAFLNIAKKEWFGGTVPEKPKTGHRPVTAMDRAGKATE